MTSSLSQQAREKLAQEYLAERRARNPQLTPSRTFCNAAQPSNSYVPPNVEPDRGVEATRALQIKSRGTRC